MKKIVYIGVTLVLVALGAAWYFLSMEKSDIAALPVYFTYTPEEIQTFKNLSSYRAITVDDVYAFDQVAFDLVAKYTKHKEFATEVSKIYAYLALAQREVAFLSYNAKGAFEGSVNPVSKKVLCIFFQADCASISSYGEEDEYVQAIDVLVMSKIEKRIAEDAAGLKAYPIKAGKEYWDGSQPSVGLTEGKSKGWFIASGDQFRVPPPPAFESKEFKDQLVITREALKNATLEQKRATVFWAGGPGTKTPPGQLLSLGDEYMQTKNIPLSKVLLVRSVLTAAVADAVTAVFDSKYTYLVKRPFMMDPSLITIMPTPNHPSYPAGHSTLSAAGTTVLEHYFPEDKKMWQEKAYEAGMSRIWGGIHYMMDHEAGVTLGRKVAESAIQGTVWQE